MQTHTQQVLPRQQEQDVSDKEGITFQSCQHPLFPSGEDSFASRPRSHLGQTLCTCLTLSD